MLTMRKGGAWSLNDVSFSPLGLSDGKLKMLHDGSTRFSFTVTGVR